MVESHYDDVRFLTLTRISMSDNLAAVDPRGSRRIIASADSTLWAQVDRRPFAFQHHLADDPLFDLDRLAKLAKHADDVRGSRTHISRKAHPVTMSIADRILHLDESDDWIKISYANKLDDDYRRIHDRLLEEIESLSGMPIRSALSWSGLTIFMNSPNLVVPYHFDHETNFLMQVRGIKDVEIFDQSDRSILTEREIERFYFGDAMAGRYRSEFENCASSFVLEAGDAVHHPPLAPHRIFNRDRISISVSLFFSFPEADRRAHVYQVNSIIRHCRLKPMPPGRRLFVDQVKIILMRTISRCKPKDQSQTLFSGVRRLEFPRRAVRKVLRALGRHAGRNGLKITS